MAKQPTPSLTWSTRPPTDKHQHVPIHRPRPAARPLTGIITSHDVLGVELHWLGRSVPHVEPRSLCEGCKAERPRRWEGYVSVWNPRTNAQFLVALTPGVMPTVEHYLELHGTLRGAAIALARPGGKPTSRCTLDLERADAPEAQLPKPPDIAHTLAHVWGIDKSHADAVTGRPAETNGHANGAPTNRVGTRKKAAK